MKKIVLITLACLALIGLVYAGGKTLVVTNGKTLSTAGQTDTLPSATGTSTLDGASNVELQWSYTGMDSLAVSYIYVDGYIAGRWQLAMATDSTWLNESAVSGGKGILLRGYGTNKIPGAELIRFRIVSGIVPTADSLSALSYKLKVITR